MNTSIKTHSKSMASMVGATLIVLACAAASGPVMAQQEQFLTKTVAYGDLDIDSAQGARTLFVRIRYAAQEVCSPLDSRELARKRAWQSCVHNALASAVTKINQPMVTALYNQSSNRPSAG